MKYDTTKYVRGNKGERKPYLAAGYRVAICGNEKSLFNFFFASEKSFMLSSLTEILRGSDGAGMLDEFHPELEVVGHVCGHESLVGVPDGTHELEGAHLVHA